MHIVGDEVYFGGLLALRILLPEGSARSQLVAALESCGPNMEAELEAAYDRGFAQGYAEGNTE